MTSHDSRIEKAKEVMEEDNLDILVLLTQENVFYLSGVYFKHPFSSAFILPQEDDPTVLTHEYEFFRALDESRIENVHNFKKEETLYSSIINHLKNFFKTASIGVEMEYIPHPFYQSLQEAFSHSQILPASYVLEDLRVIKTSDEQTDMRKSCELLDIAINSAIEVAHEGVTELEIVAKAEEAMRSKGAADRSFRSIISSGMRTSYTHGWATEKTLNSGDLVMLDMGAVYNNYCSDMTRMGKIGKISKEQYDIVETSIESYQVFLDFLKPGVKVDEVVTEALKPFKRKGYEKNMVHDLGRGLGLSLFERPYLIPENEEVLQSGMTIGLSPAIFMRGKYGCRIEGVVLITDTGNESLSKIDPELKDL